MIIVQVKEGDNIEKALKKFKRKFEKTGIVKELRSRQAFEKPSVTNRKKMMKAVYVQQLRRNENKPSHISYPIPRRGSFAAPCFFVSLSLPFALPSASHVFTP